MTHEHNATLDCHLWPKEPHRCRVILYVQRTFSSLSWVGCAVIVLLIIILKKYKSTTQRVIFWLSVSSFFRSLAILLTHPTTVTSFIAASEDFSNNISIVQLYYGFWWSQWIPYLWLRERLTDIITIGTML